MWVDLRNKKRLKDLTEILGGLDPDAYAWVAIDDDGHLLLHIGEPWGEFDSISLPEVVCLDDESELEELRNDWEGA